jgi:hypothetical protein
MDNGAIKEKSKRPKDKICQDTALKNMNEGQKV